MRKILPILLALFFALLAFAPNGEKPSERADEEAHYKVQYIRGGIRTKMATATLTMYDTDWKGTPAHAAGFSVQAASVFKLFLRNEYKVNLILSKKDLSPYYYSFPHVKKGKMHYLEFFYGKNEVESVLQIEDTPEPVRKIHPKNGLVTLDVASFVFYFRNLDPASLPDKPMRVQVLLGSTDVFASLSYLGKDATFWKGESCFHYVLKMEGRGLLENKSGDEIHVWISSGAERSLRGLEIQLDKGSVVAKMLEE